MAAFGRSMRAAWILTVATALVAAAAAQAPSSTFTDDLAKPVDLAFAADGTLYLAELDSGKIRALSIDGAPQASTARLPASAGGNGGFTGLAADPTDPTIFYAVYSFEKPSAPHGKVNRVARIAGGVETVLFDDIPWAEFHVGGRIAVGPDGHLYVTTGDNGGPDGDDYTRTSDPSLADDAAQDPGSLIGKVLRLTKDGAPAGGVDGWHPAVFARGLRNPFGLAFGPDGTLYASENGIERDELNVIVQGANYGWPICEGDCGRADVRAPLFAWDGSFGTTGVAFLDGVVHVGEFNDGRLHAVPASGGTATVAWTTGGDPILDVAAGPDGCLYVSTFDTVHRVDVRATGACGLGRPPTPDPPPTPPPPVTPPVEPPPPTEPAPPSPTTPIVRTPTAATPPAEATPASPTPPLPPSPSPTLQESNPPGTEKTPAPPMVALLAVVALAGWLIRRPGER